MNILEYYLELLEKPKYMLSASWKSLRTISKVATVQSIRLPIDRLSTYSN